MEETPSFELPKDCEKLATKFILDTLHERSAAVIGPTTEISTEVIVEAEPVVVDEADPSPVPLEPLGLPDGKKYFRVREVAELTGVEPYVLRYWESEFSSVRPTKSRTGQRVYSRRDVEELYLIRHLLHVEKYSIKGAKKKLQERRLNRAGAADQILRQRQQRILKELQGQLKELLQIIRGNPGLQN